MHVFVRWLVGVAQGFGVLMRLIVAAAANEITKSRGRPASGGHVKLTVPPPPPPPLSSGKHVGGEEARQRGGFYQQEAVLAAL